VRRVSVGTTKLDHNVSVHGIAMRITTLHLAVIRRLWACAVICSGSAATGSLDAQTADSARALPPVAAAAPRVWASLDAAVGRTTVNGRTEQVLEGGFSAQATAGLAVGLTRKYALEARGEVLGDLTSEDCVAIPGAVCPAGLDAWGASLSAVFLGGRGPSAPTVAAGVGVYRADRPYRDGGGASSLFGVRASADVPMFVGRGIAPVLALRLLVLPNAFQQRAVNFSVGAGVRVWRP
jgi:hypothetical protein